MWIGAMELDILLGDMASLKQKRSVVRPLVADLHRTYAVSVAEVAHTDLHRWAGIGVAMASADRQHLVEVLDALERSVAGRPEIDLLSVHRSIRTIDDD